MDFGAKGPRMRFQVSHFLPGPLDPLSPQLQGKLMGFQDAAGPGASSLNLRLWEIFILRVSLNFLKHPQLLGVGEYVGVDSRDTV